ncbi:MAG: FAD-dependent oxidoreductase [Rubrivivax sp.]|nr:FAD-dependent oxidoreductase [Rubrivivax sp.]
MTAMPLPIPPTWTTGSTEVFATGTWRAAMPRHVHAPSPCHQACPINGEIADWIGHARQGRWREAWEVLTRRNPFPAIIGRVCHHPCEMACNRMVLDTPIAICALERAVGDAALAAGWQFTPPAVERDGRVAVVGAGPAGLSAAFQLRQRGWQVTLVDSQRQAGGLLRSGIPAYRLSRAVLDTEIDRVLALGITLRMGQPLQTTEDWQALRATHDAVFVATGAALPRRLPGLPYGGLRVMDGAAWLAAANAGHPPALGPAVVVIGGGSAALDAARSARRAGHAVTLLALESRAAMPAQPAELHEALEEGVKLVDGAMLQRLSTEADGLHLHCVQVRLRPAGPGAPLVPETLPDSAFALGADALLVSIGQDADLDALGGWLPAQGRLLTADAEGLTGEGGWWAGGDVASHDRHVSSAIGMGRRAALAIHRHLCGETAAVAAAEPVVSAAAIATWYHDPAPRADAGRLPVAQRLAGGAEVQCGLDTEAAIAEASRCFSCGLCVACDQCVTWCPDLAVWRDDAGYHIDADHCKGCGLCVRECPSGAMVLEEEQA